MEQRTRISNNRMVFSYLATKTRVITYGMVSTLIYSANPFYSSQITSYVTNKRKMQKPAWYSLTRCCNPTMREVDGWNEQEKSEMSVF